MRATMTSSVFGTFAAALGVVGCGGNDFDEVSNVQGVRVLAVRPSAPVNGDDPNAGTRASGFPGQTMTLDMLYMDGRVPVPDPREPPPSEPLPGDPESGDPESGDPPALSLAWLGGCHNPPSRLYYACGPQLKETAEGLVASGRDPFGRESPFVLSIPDDILSSAPVVPTDPIHFGVSYVFFGVCAGTIRLGAERSERLPFECVDASENVLGQRDFVVGFTTIYTYEGVTNLNPTLDNVLFNGMPVSGPACREPGACEVPRVSPCDGEHECPEYRIAPEVNPSSFERLPDGANEILWASYYTTQGDIVKDSQLVADRVAGRVDDFTSGWHAPAAPGIVRLWVTLNDERGGATWASFDVIVE